MNKQELRSALEGLTEGQTITINFRNSHEYTSGDYVFLGSRRGRGKGGSLLAELSLVGEDAVSVVGTKDSDEIVNVAVDGTTYGLEDERDLPINFETNVDNALELKRLFKFFLQDNICPRRVIVSSQLAELNREFIVTGGKQLRGRVGQVQLQTAEGIKLCSYGHSTVIQALTIVED